MTTATLTRETRETKHDHAPVSHEDFEALCDKFINAPTDAEAAAYKKELMVAFYKAPHAEDQAD